LLGSSVDLPMWPLLVVAAVMAISESDVASAVLTTFVLVANSAVLVTSSGLKNEYDQADPGILRDWRLQLTWFAIDLYLLDRVRRDPRVSADSALQSLARAYHRLLVLATVSGLTWIIVALLEW